ncbi:MAG: NAD(P)H-hydrate epimerase [Planctomycetes bacterium]|nr:NAD(P)H-hydrate epimerase [Planctomycetota bacterium]
MDTFCLNREQAQAIDRYAIDRLAIPGTILMENAGRGCVDAMLDAGLRGPVTVCCGRGNNGGDGMVIARHLLRHGITCRTMVWGPADKLAPDALRNWTILQRAGHPVARIDQESDVDACRELLEGAAWIVDALLGTGTRGAPRSPLDHWIDAINRSAARRVAIDIPSGLDADTGEPASSTVRAAITCTMVAPKTGFANPRAREFFGELRVVDIGVPLDWLHQAALPGN